MNRAAETRLVLLGDGPSDAALLPIVHWLLRSVRADIVLSTQFAQHRSDYSAAIQSARLRWQPHLILVHRDAEGLPLNIRVRELPRGDDIIALVPVRMTEAWLLSDEGAIRRAADNPNGKTVLGLPRSREIETLPNPKRVLQELLRAASELPGPRRRARFSRDLGHRVHLVAQHTATFEPLRQLNAFRAFEAAIREALARI